MGKVAQTASVMGTYFEQTKESRKLYERAKRVIPSGTNRGVIFYRPYPVYSMRGRGSRLWDVDGTERIDYCFNYSSLILGHRNKAVIGAVKDELERGLGRGQPTGPEVELAEKVTTLYPAAEMVKFTVSGTEAVMNTIRAARAYTGRKKIIAFEGAYHGSSDGVSGRGLAFSTQGIPQEILNTTLVCPFNSPHALERMMKENVGDVAAVIMEPFLAAGGTIAPDPQFGKFVREITEKMDTLLILDEIISAFRISRGGWSGKHKIEPDLATLGKNVTGGMPGGAIVGRKDVMDDAFAYRASAAPEQSIAKTPLSGTFNAFPLSMAAGIATLDQLSPQVYEKIDSTAGMVRDGFQKAAEEAGIETRTPIVGSVFQFYFTRNDITDIPSTRLADSRLRWLFDIAMLNEGVFLAPSHFCCTSASTTGRDVRETISGIRRALEKIKPIAAEIAPEIATSSRCLIRA